MIKSNLNEISRGRYKSKDQKIALEKVKFLYESQEAVIKLFNDYSSIASKAKYNKIHGKWIPSISARVACGRIAKAFDYSNLEMLSPKQMLKGLSIALAQIKAGNPSKSLFNEIRQIIYSLYGAKEITKKI